MSDLGKSMGRMLQGKNPFMIEEEPEEVPARAPTAEEIETASRFTGGLLEGAIDQQGTPIERAQLQKRKSEAALAAAKAKSVEAMARLEKAKSAKLTSSPGGSVRV